MMRYNGEYSSSDREYLDWFYHTVRQMYKGVDGFDRIMADRFKRETGQVCPFYIKRTTTDTSST